VTTSPRWVIQHYPTLTSTMDRAALFARAGAPEGIVVVSDEQTAGRGRAGRAWHSPSGAALYATLLLRPNVPPPALATLPLLAGVAVAEALEFLTGAVVQLKWPNDVWLGSNPEQRKVAGILLTSAISGQQVNHVLCGIGVNLATPLDQLPPGATSVLAATGTSVRPSEMLDALLPAFAARYNAYQIAAGQPALDAWRTRAAMLGEVVTVQDAGQARTGRFAGIDTNGALLLEQGGAIHRVVAGDLTRGPQMAGG
jgi:BirA family transcriptional regulator, biotin operon repressor / biotin---[acetyl-CoA-carboxylase] ligase